MSDFATPEPDRTEQNTPITDDGDELSSPIDLVAEAGIPLDANEADVLEQAYVEETDPAEDGHPV